ncbi:TPA: DUF1642 domain-containing protein [Listeria monocytogenes]|uniref:DUF1642 domain-containing protein n=1 Tax=Listeria monocytogenes TaxID=1639 RepID=UPI0013F44EF8|nr:DUF1642 domain-containing protein [Listeria monocytogenes]EFQ7888147.1 DUF1642 domain-containing protein [Listeria monocytogenes]EFQ7938244.1 DUF1642 domain-containing protein [Listeria monocytogenes]EFQ7942123.1 DUF1642 domain-containing protein [Listeria monocytogenes]EFQ7950284.1 DUF1642 domain-containing protein [Listeria monocytogenes]EFQ7952181.1 DUF1642 domain-containing protein [Listeria monocytogenes]
MRFKEGDKVQFIENNELIIGTIKRVNNDVGWVDLKVSDLSWFFRKLEDVVKVKEPELIAVPRFAADWIKHCKQREYDLACLLEYGNAGIPDEMYEWLISSADNQELFARAWMGEYEVEQEPLYYIKAIDSYSGYVNLNLKTGTYTMSTNGEFDGYKTKFTESEIKNIDTRYWDFAVPVEEVEETE